jgi:hypothetical protein
VPNNNGLAAGSGFFQGFNSIFTPYIMRQTEMQQQQAFATRAALKKELTDILSQQMDLGLFDENDKDAQEAIQFAYSSDINAKEPKNLAHFMAGARMRLQEMEGAVPQAMDVLSGNTPTPAPAPAAPPPQPPQQQPPTDGAPPINMDASAASLRQIGGDPSLLAAPGAAPVEPAPEAQPEQPAAPEPMVFGNTPAERAALNIARKQFGGITTTIRHRNGSVSFPGLSVTSREKLVAGKALRDALNDVPLEQAMANVTNPQLRKGIQQAWGQEQMKRMMKAGIPPEEAVRSIAVLGGSDAVPKRDWDMVMGPGLAAAKTEAQTPAIINRERQKTDVLVEREDKLRPGKVQTATETAEAKAPIEIDKAEEITTMRKRLDNEFSTDDKHLVGKALGIDFSQPLSDDDAALLLETMDKRKARGAHNKLVDKITTEQQMKASERVPYQELQSLYDPDSGKPAGTILRNGGTKTITRDLVDNMGAVSLDKAGVEILRSAQKTNKILDQYLDAALKIFTSENPNANAVRYYSKMLTANADYQDLLSENGKLATMIRALGEKGALAEGDVERGINALLMLRGRVSRSQIIESVAEINEIIQTGVDAMGFNSANIVPRPSQLGPAEAPARLPVQE